MTIYDISEKAGVSIATVSRVLNGNSNVSEKTKKKVLDVINKYEYTPNAFARGLGLNTMKTIGIMCADSSDLYLAKAIYYIEQKLRANGYDSILCCTGYGLETLLETSGFRTLSETEPWRLEPGGKYEDAYVATMLGPLASCKFYAGELVYAVLRFQAREYNGQMYQDILAVDLIKIKD